jgi:hypothetical protein
VAHAYNLNHSGGSQFEASLGKYFTDPILKKPLPKKKKKKKGGWWNG